MIKKFVMWFICFGLSFLVQNLGWAEQGKAFLYIEIGVYALIALGIIVLVVAAGLTTGFAAESLGLSFLSALVIIAAIAITLFATWGATKLFDIDFYIAYQIMTFGQCLCTTKKSKED